MECFTSILTICVCVIPKIHSEVITLHNQNEIYCLSNILEPIYVVPSTLPSTSLEKSTFAELWKNDDWIKQIGVSSNMGAILDKRWESLGETYTNHQTFPLASSVSFSVYNAKMLRFHLSGFSKTKDMIIIPKNLLGWVHYSVKIINKTAYIIESNSILVNSTDVDEVNDVNQISITTTENIHWRIHQYLFMEAYDSSYQPSILTIPPSTKSCVLLYTALSDKSYITVNISNGLNETKLVIDSNDNIRASVMPGLRLWKQNKIDIDSDIETKFIFDRRTNDGSDDGFWAIDIRPCPDIKKSMGIYKAYVPESNLKKYSCHILNSTKTTSTNSHEDLKNPTFCAQPGKLGVNCDITCESILGSKYKNCEQTRICVNSICECAWGYHGTSCQKSCGNSSWGISCQNSCEEGCTNCDKRTGECIKGISTISVIAIVMAVILAIALIASPLLFVYRRRKFIETKEAEAITPQETKQNLIENVALVEEAKKDKLLKKTTTKVNSVINSLKLRK